MVKTAQSGYYFQMTSTDLAQAFAKAKSLPQADQDRLARDLERYFDSLAVLRGKLDKGIRSLDAGLGKQLEMEAVIAKARACRGP